MTMRNYLKKSALSATRFHSQFFKHEHELNYVLFLTVGAT